MGESFWMAVLGGVLGREHRRRSGSDKFRERPLLAGTRTLHPIPFDLDLL